jgi:hypothetical protein
MIPIRKHLAIGTLGSLVILGAIFLTQGPSAPFASEPPTSQVGAVGTIPQLPEAEVLIPVQEEPQETTQGRLPFDPREVTAEALREVRELDDSELENEDTAGDEEEEGSD